MNQIMNILKIATLTVCCTLTFSCVVPKRAALPELKPLPDHFAYDSSRVQAPLLSRDSFFKDPHLKQLLNNVLDHNPDMHIALQRIATAGAWLMSSRGALLPAISLGANASATHFGKYTMEGVGNFDTNLSPNIDDDQKIGTSPTPDFWLGINASWEADLWGKLRAQKEGARRRFLASVQGADMVRSMLVAQTATLYYELVMLDREQAVLEENLGLQERALEIVTVQKEAGRATELAVQQFKAQGYSTKAALRAIKQRIAEATNELNALAGRYDGSITRDALQPLDQLFHPQPGSGVPAGLLRQRPDIRQAESQLLAAHADLAAARAAFFPSVNISAYTALNAFKGSLLLSGASLGYQLLGGLTAPVFQKNQLRAQHRLATAQQQESYYQYERSVLNAYKEVINQMSGIRNLAQTDSLKQLEVDALSNGIGISEELYLTGYASYIEIVAAQKSKMEAELQLIGVKRDEIYAFINLYKSLGGGWR
ncbi:efflux transporter outer membrane subunit [Taibaiella helva]|uniref:efflux transporter outer membrane subunit n=1 Tax=Taibaiella helva TaxID=2301235 RepID=UPI000E56CC91|nr:TolC family protein [Taibaiella helva]